MIEFGSLIIASLLNVLLGLVVFVKNPKSVTNKLFLVLASSFSVWSTVNYLSVHPVIFSQIVWVRLVLFCAAFLCLAMFLTFTVFPSHNMVGNKTYRKLAIAATVFVMILTQTPYVFKLDDNSKPAPNIAIGFFAILVTVLLSSGIANLVIKFRRSFGKERDQLRLVLIGIAGTFSLIFLTNFLAVVLFRFTSLIPFGPTFTLVFSGSLAYAIISQKLFDIRAAVARSVAYILLVGTMSFVYSVVLFGFINVIFAGEHKEILRQVFSVLLVFPLALSFQSIKRWFDKVTNKLFFRDVYDTQIVLNELGSVLAIEIDLRKILVGSKNVLTDALKSSFIEFVLVKNNKLQLESIGSKVFHSHIDSLAVHIKEQKRSLLVVEEMGIHNPLRNLLSEEDIAVSIQLKTQNQIVGYILFGNKKSGDIYTSQDIKLLTIVANEMAVATQNALRFEEIEEFNITLQQKVEEATKQLRQTNEKLKQMDQTKDDFISMASHQLRTPLTSVKGYVSMVIDGDAGKITATQRKLLDQAFISSQRMVYLIADLLNVSRLKTGKFVIEAKPTNLAEVVESEIAQLTETAKGRNLELTYTKPKDFTTLMLDEVKIRQVIMNFADNAIYYTPAGGHITVSLAETPQTVEFTVVDDGIGVPKSEEHHLFNKFYRAGNARKARPDGTGLGLFMAKKVVIAQGGAIIFKTQEGKGSTFGFSFAKDKLLPENYKGTVAQEATE